MENDLQRRLEARQYSQAFDLLVAQFRDKVFHLAVSMLRNDSQAEDVAQDVFLKIWKALPGCRTDSSLSSWVYTITRNTCLTELKKRLNQPTVSLQDPDFADSAGAIPALQSADPAGGARMDVQTMLGRLPEKYRRVIVLFYLEQKSYEETAALLSLPLGTVKTLLFRAKRELLRLASPPETRPGGCSAAPPPIVETRALRIKFSPLHAPTQG